MADAHSVTLRTRRPSSSTTPDASTAQPYQHDSPVGGTTSRVLPSQSTNSTTRFFSNQYPYTPQGVVESGNHSPRDARDSSVFLEYPQGSHGVNVTSSRSRISTVSPPQSYAHAAAGPISPQRSGSQSVQPHGNSRPASRSAAGSPFPTMSGGVGSSSAAAASAQSTPSKSPFSTPIIALPRQRLYHILLINPNSTRTMTDNCLAVIRPTLPPGIELTGYTAPYPAPTAIESTTDAIMSTEAVLRDLAKRASSNGETVDNFDGMIVACFSRHPLVEALRESYDVPVIGIMEASFYVARMLGARFGIVTTVARAKFQQEDDVHAYGLSHFYVGTVATELGVLELETRSRDEVSKKIQNAARTLAQRGADTILLGCAGMSEMIRAAKDGVRDEDGRRTVNVIDAVEAAVQLMSGLVAMGVPTSKKGMYKGEREGRRARGQNWL